MHWQNVAAVQPPAPQEASHMFSQACSEQPWVLVDGQADDFSQVTQDVLLLLPTSTK
jgi:hypothetical protein